MKSWVSVAYYAKSLMPVQLHSTAQYEDFERREECMSNNTLCCDYCESTYRKYLSSKTKTICFEKVCDLTQVNSDGREVDNICLECLKEQIDNYGI